MRAARLPAARALLPLTACSSRAFRALNDRLLPLLRSSPHSHRSCIEEVNERVKQWIDFKNFNPRDVAYVDCAQHFLVSPALISARSSRPASLSFTSLRPNAR